MYGTRETFNVSEATTHSSDKNQIQSDGLSQLK